LLDREGQNRAKVLSNMIKQKRKEKAVSKFMCHNCLNCSVKLNALNAEVGSKGILLKVPVVPMLRQNSIAGYGLSFRV